MRLPNDSVGISDILAYRECPRRFAFQMRRWTEGSDPPGDQPQHPGTRYGTVVHYGIELIESEMLTDQEAVDRCFDRYAAWLEPEDVQRLLDDFATYRQRDITGVRTIASEGEIRLPLFKWPCPECGGTGAVPVPSSSDPNVPEPEPCQDCDATGEVMIYFRAKIDRLYQSVANPAAFVHVDYKSSRWRVSEEDIHKDKQLWSYNAAIHRYWPECEHLTQWYDQLAYGQTPTHKSPEQREEIWEWIKKQVRSILREDALEPTHNQWCPSCEILESCSEVKRLGQWALARIEELVGDSGKLPSDVDVERGFEQYVEDLDLISRAEKMTKRYGESVREVLKELPDGRLAELGYTKSQRSSKVWTPRAKAAIRDLVGEERFLTLVGITQTRVKEMLDKDEQEIVMGMANKEAGAKTVRKK